MAKQKRTVSYKKRPKKIKPAPPLEDGVERDPDEPDAAAFAEPMPEREPGAGLVALLPAALGLSVLAGLALAGHNAGAQTVGDPPDRTMLLSGSLALGTLLLAGTVIRRRKLSRWVWATAVFMAVCTAVMPWLGRSGEEQALSRNQQDLASMLDGPRLAAADEAAGFAWRERAGKLELAERPPPADSSVAWSSTAAESSLIRPPEWTPVDKGAVVAWAGTGVRTLHGAHRLLPVELRAQTPGEVRWVALVQEESGAAEGWWRADVRVIDLADGRVVATGTREAPDAVTTAEIAGVVRASSCAGYADAEACLAW